MSSADDNYTIHKVSLKRTRQACGPCRRKKARCPGEKPSCSLCQRLGQRCIYGQQVSPRRTRQSGASTHAYELGRSGDGEGNGADSPSSLRLQRIEERLDKMTYILHESLPKASPGTTAPDGNPQVCRASEQHDICSLRPAFHYQRDNPGISLWPSLPTDYIKSEVETYLTYFHDQPYCVFSKQWLLRRACSQPPEIAFPLVALTSRFPRASHETLDGEIPIATYCAKKAWDILSSQHRDGQMGLSFLQGTFLMAQVDFADGQANRAYASVALGLRILQSAGMNKDKYASSFSDAEAEARRRIAWAFFMLDRSYNASRDYSLCLSDKHFTLPFPSSEGPRQGDGLHVRGTLHDGQEKHDEKTDHGILACLLRLYSLWGKATEYVFEPLDKEALPPWQAGSPLAMLESEWLQFETHFADKHRYINVDFQRRAREEHHSRAYLSTWLCVQFLFHSIQCLLHHPFVVMVKVRHMKGNLSTTFLQKSHETSLLHSRWIARFIKEMAEVDLQLYDPFFGYLAAVAATIQLEHTVSKNPQVSLLVNNEFRTLVDFMEGLAAHWENMRVLVGRVNELSSRHQNYGSLYYNRDGYSGALSSMPTPSNIPRMSAEDEALMWDILDFGSSCSSAETTRLGDLVPVRDQQAGTEALDLPEFRLPLSPHEVRDRNGYQSEPSAAGNNPSPPPYGRVPESVSEDPMSAWPLADGNRNGALDIPDWMILGGMVEHL